MLEKGRIDIVMVIVFILVMGIASLHQILRTDLGIEVVAKVHHVGFFSGPGDILSDGLDPLDRAPDRDDVIFPLEYIRIGESGLRGLR